MQLALIEADKGLNGTNLCHSASNFNVVRHLNRILILVDGPDLLKALRVELLYSWTK